MHRLNVPVQQGPCSSSQPLSANVWVAAPRTSCRSCMRASRSWLPAPAGLQQEPFRQCQSPSECNRQRHRRHNAVLGDKEAEEQTWNLMGRVLSAEQLLLGKDARLNITLSAAAIESGLGPEAFADALTQLLLVLPDMKSGLLSLNPKVLAALLLDIPGTVAKLLHLRALFPLADISHMVCQRPVMLMPEEWEQVEPARQYLLTRFSQQQVDQLVTAQPLLLVTDVELMLDDLQRLVPGIDPQQALLRNPGLVTQLMSNRKLSLWLMPQLQLYQGILRDPSLVPLVQRGKSLGPGAEYMV